MVSPGTHLVNSQESLSITSESQLENKESLIENAWYGPFNQTVNLETDTKTGMSWFISPFLFFFALPCRIRHYVESMQMLCHKAM